MERRGVSRPNDYQYLIDRTKKIIFPILYKYGFDAHWIREEQIDTLIPTTQTEAWADWNMRLSKDGVGSIIKVYSNKNIKRWIPIQPTIIRSVQSEYTKNYPIFNMPGPWIVDMMKDLSNPNEPSLIKKLGRHNLITLGIHFLIVTESGDHYWLGSWKDIPEEFLFTSYSKSSTKPNKLKTSAKFNLKKFKHISKFEGDLQNRINEFCKTTLTYGKQYRRQTKTERSS